MRRNLLYYVYPVRDSIWRWNVEQLLARWPVFDGRRIVIVAVDGRTVPATEVRAAFSGRGAEFVERGNDRTMGETAAFIAALEGLASTSPDEATFYAHAKGVTRDGKTLENVRSWAAAMYAMNLDRPELVESALSTHDAAGCFLHDMDHAGSKWHYSGTFFWFRHEAVFSRPDWRRIEWSRSGVEGWIGRVVARGRAFALTPFRHFDDLYRYGVGEPEWRAWLRGERPAPSSVRG